MRATILATAISLAFISLSSAADAEAAITRHTDIPPQPLAPALQRLVKERDVQLVYRAELIADLRTPGASGQLSVVETLAQLLNGTGLTYRHLDDKTLTIQPLVVGGGKSQEPKPAGVSAEKTTQIDVHEGRIRLFRPVRLAQADQTGVAGRAGSAEPAPASASRRAAMLEEIIVTAQKRTERLQDVPISVAVLDGVALDKSTAQGVTEMLGRVPAVAANVGYQGGATLVTIRGVAAANAIGAGSSPNAYYLDSAPFGFVIHAVAPDANAYDLERVEVLRGPQGTLYGASALNGVVRVLTKDANLETTQFKARGSISSTADGGENYRGDMAVNVPLVEGKLAARAVAGHQDLSGWIDRVHTDDANDGQVNNYRLKINAQPTEALSIGLSAWLLRSDFDAPPVANDLGTHRSSMDEPTTTDYDVYSVKIGYDLPAFSVTSMSSYIDYQFDSLLDQTLIGSTTLMTNVGSEVFTEEVVLNSRNETNWRWSFGGIYRDAKDDHFQLRPPPVYVAPNHVNFTSESFAVFGQLTRLFMDGQFELTGGLRYFEDDVVMQEQSRSSVVLLPSQRIRAPASFDAVSPRLVLTWKASDRMTVYGSYSEGFRSGAHQFPAVVFANPNFPPLDADTLTNYELGAKGNLWDGRLTFEAAAFYIDWQDIQQALTVVVQQTPQVVSSVANVNGDSASGTGADLALSAAPLSGLEVGVSFGWNDLIMDEDVKSGPLILFDKGDRLNFSPEFTAGAFADYTFALGAGGLEGQLSISGNFISEQGNRTIFAGALQYSESDDLLLGRASFAIRAPDRWATTLFVDNIGNTQRTAATSIFPTLFPEWETHPRPRTIGLQIEYSFDQ
jgi:iron complex outermembrane recepter protein